MFSGSLPYNAGGFCFDNDEWDMKKAHASVRQGKWLAFVRSIQLARWYYYNYATTPYKYVYVCACNYYYFLIVSHLLIEFTATHIGYHAILYSLCLRI